MEKNNSTTQNKCSKVFWKNGEQNKTKHNLWLLFLTVFVLSLSFLFGCKTTKQNQPNIYNQPQAYILSFDFIKFDSLCINDTLPKDLQYWNKIQLRDYESKNISTQYMYNKNDSVYILDIISDNNKSDTVIYKRIIHQ